jgi:hypothetical protein
MCCVEGARIELLLLIADAQEVDMWTFLMGAVDAGVLLLSSRLNPVL